MATDNLFNDNWLKLQQQYWEGLAEMGRKAMGLDVPEQNPWEAAPWNAAPWQSAMEQWWKTLSPAAPDPSKVFMDRLMEQGKAYFATVERLTRGLTWGADASAGWEALNKTFEDMQRVLTGDPNAFGSGVGGGQADATMRRMLGFWEMPLDNWQRMMSSLSPLVPGDLLRNMPHDQVKDSVDRMLSAPGLGYTREEQAQYQDLVRRTLDYQRALQEYMGFFGKLGIKSIERLKDFIQARADSDEPIDSARTLYDGWVGCCEQVYAEEVGTPEYARIHGRLVNAQMALKQRMSVMVDEALGAMNMPTRSELRTLQDRMQETRRENKQLRRELDAIKRRLSEPTAVATRAPAAPKKKPAPRKKVAVQKAPAE